MNRLSSRFSIGNRLARLSTNWGLPDALQRLGLADPSAPLHPAPPQPAPQHSPIAKEACEADRETADASQPWLEDMHCSDGDNLEADPASACGVEAPAADLSGQHIQSAAAEDGSREGVDDNALEAEDRQQAHAAASARQRRHSQAQENSRVDRMPFALLADAPQSSAQGKHAFACAVASRKLRFIASALCQIIRTQSWQVANTCLSVLTACHTMSST